MEFIGALLGIMMVNIVLSGDNAVVIAMASRNLPPKQQKMAILWGSAGAIGLRVGLTLVAVMLLSIPYLQFLGGVLLVWIAAKLLMEDGHDDESIQASDSYMSAIKTIIIADLVMSLDNTLAIAAIADGNYMLLALGLALSIPLIVFGSKLLMTIMEKYPVFIYAGAALIAWTAGEMMLSDGKVGPIIESVIPGWVIPAVITAGVLAMGFRTKQKRKMQQADHQADTEAVGPETISH